ncbi:unnamed protein product [Rotaria socialis]
MGWDCPIPRGALVAILQKRQEQVVSNPRRDRLPQQSSEDNNKRRSGPANEKNGGGLNKTLCIIVHRLFSLLVLQMLVCVRTHV